MNHWIIGRWLKFMTVLRVTEFGRATVIWWFKEYKKYNGNGWNTKKLSLQKNLRTFIVVSIVNVTLLLYCHISFRFLFICSPVKYYLEISFRYFQAWCYTLTIRKVAFDVKQDSIMDAFVFGRLSGCPEWSLYCFWRTTFHYKYCYNLEILWYWRVGKNLQIIDSERWFQLLVNRGEIKGVLFDISISR